MDKQETPPCLISLYTKWQILTPIWQTNHRFFAKLFRCVLSHALAWLASCVNKKRFLAYYIDAHIQAFSSNKFRIIYPSFSFPVGIARFPFYFPSSFRSNLICSNIYMVITTKLDKCKCVCFQRVIMVSACFVTRSCAELLQ